jgi:coproporphyrinogen III oxidase
MERLVTAAQQEICTALELLDERPFVEDRWARDAGGGGVTRVLQGGSAFDKAGVNVSSVWGELPPRAAEVMLDKEGLGEATPRFEATGLSVVIHPRSPMAPTIHCNYRYFELEDGRWWFGGGTDLTPCYFFEEDARHFHRVLREVCDRHDAAYYPRFKRWCDDYFHIPHRGEGRGLGGIFFDDLRDRPAEELFAFVEDCTTAFLPGYLPILERRLPMPWGERERQWQRLRRGRYVEFNLMYDRGTRFGLGTGGRVESILMSLPLEARWEYGHRPEAESPEAQMLEVLRHPREWA